MEKHLTTLIKCPLFYNLTKENILFFLKTEGHYLRHYEKNDLIADEDEACTALAIVLTGSVEIQKIYSTGKTVTLTRIHAGNIFGEAIIFSHQKKYPATIVTTTKSTLLFIDSDQIIRMCSSNPQILENFMKVLSDKLLMLNKKVYDLSFSTIREKICSFILEEYQHQKKPIIKVGFSRKIMAEHMGIQRPSLSRELINLKNQGLIDFTKDTILIKDIIAIENIVLS